MVDSLNKERDTMRALSEDLARLERLFRMQEEGVASSYHNDGAGPTFKAFVTTLGGDELTVDFAPTDDVATLTRRVAAAMETDMPVQLFREGTALESGTLEQNDCHGGCQLDVVVKAGTPLTDETIRGAFKKWCESSTRAEVVAVYGEIEAWDVSSVTDMYRLFNGCNCAHFNANIGAWNVSAVTNMQGMFQAASSFNQPLGAWDVSAVTNMQSMFQAASSFNQPLGAWDVSAVKDMSQMFMSASSFNHPLGAWDVSAVTDMKWMFAFASSFNQPLGRGTCLR